MIDVIMAKALTNHLLEKIGFFIRTFCRSETGDTLARNITMPDKAICRHIKRFFPAGFAEMCQRVCRINIQPLCRRIITADQWLGQTVIVMNIVKTEPALYTKPVFVGRAIHSFNIFDFIILDFKGQLTANTAIRANRLDFAIKVFAIAVLRIIKNACRHQGTGWTGLNTFTTGNTG